MWETQTLIIGSKEIELNIKEMFDAIPDISEEESPPVLTTNVTETHSKINVTTKGPTVVTKGPTIVTKGPTIETNGPIVTTKSMWGKVKV